MLSESEQSGPPDEWLALSDAERAEVLRRFRDEDLDRMETAVAQAAARPNEPVAVAVVAPARPATAPTLVDAMETAESLTPDDRMRLIAWLWETLPQRNRAAIIAFGLENMRYPDHGKITEPGEKPVAHSDPIEPIDPIWPKIWEVLFDRTKVSELYSAPRRFDLATIFVITAAYSILFGAMSALNYYFGPATQVVVGVIVTLIGVSQAYFYHTANPRGVSVVSGAIVQTAILSMIAILVPRWFGVSFFIVFVFYGLVGGAITGYLAGTVVGGVFLVADLLRKRYLRPPDDDVTSDSNLPHQEESPWTN